MNDQERLARDVIALNTSDAMTAATKRSVAARSVDLHRVGRVLGEELAEAESQLKAHFKDSSYHYWEGVCNGIETAIDALQRIEKHSTDTLSNTWLYELHRTEPWGMMTSTLRMVLSEAKNELEAGRTVEIRVRQHRETPTGGDMARLPARKGNE